MNILENSKLVNLSTERLIELKKKLNKVVGRRRHDVEAIDVITTPEDYQLYHLYVDFAIRVKDILNEHEHIDPKKHGEKHGHDKRGRRNASMSKRGY